LTIATHRLSTEELRRLAAVPDPALSRKLLDGQYAKNVLLLRFLLDHLPPALATVRPTFTAAEDADPAGFRDLLLEPMVGAWLSRTAGQLGARRDAADLSRAAAVAAVAAARCRLDVDLTLPSGTGWIELPTMGRAPTGTSVLARIHDGALHLSGAGPWQQIRPLIPGTGDRPILLLEDLDPGRDMFGVPVSGRLDPDSYRRWRSTAEAAWQLLTEHVPSHAADMVQGLRVAVPLVGPAGKALSITARQAFGAFGASEPESPADFAGTMAHEYQHSKLNAVLDMTRLEDGTDPRGYFAPWREDPRPLLGVLHGIYAFLGIAGCWRGLLAVPALARVAEGRLAETRLWVSAALDQVQGSTALTPEGRAFAGGLRRALDEVSAVDLPSAVVAAGERSLVRLRREWELRRR
jgi:uncharacterized protein